jgi:hypothetical protein
METMRHEAYEITQLLDRIKASVFALITLRWSSKGSSVRNTPPPTPIIPVTPNYELMKTPIVPPENYLGTNLESRPPSYHIQQYRPSPRNHGNPTSDKSTASSSQSSRPPTINKYKPFEDPAQYTSLTPLKPTRRTRTKTPTPTTTTTKGASTSGPPKTSSTHPLTVVNTPEWDG